MLGRTGGVAKKLQHSSPSLVPFHCPAHRLDLAIQDIAGRVGYSLPRSYSRMNLYLKLSRFSGMSTNSTKAPQNERRVSKRSLCFDKSRWLNCLTP